MYATIAHFSKNSGLFTSSENGSPRNSFGRENEDLTLALPWPDEGKSPKTYNYLSQESIARLEERIELEMLMDLYERIQENKFRKGIGYLKTITTFIGEYCLEGVKDDALYKRYDRWKKLVEKDRNRF